ncbi:MAG: cation diffusion facilitator family transporter [Thaumarchaeota archaeon]|nr:cation diffusion facilitator family transporter [Nitrososphaerota archaeon]
MQNVKTHALKISLGIILSAFAVELVIGISSNSLGLVTDSIHAVLDSVVTGILLVTARWSAKPPDTDHTYGHGKIETMGSFVGGLIILAIACFFILEAISRFGEPRPAVLPGMMAVGAAVYTICSDGARVAILKRAMGRTEASSLRVDYYHAFMDIAATSVALAGILLVVVGFYQGDFVAGLILGFFLAALSLKLIYRNAMELTDAVPESMVRSVRDIVSGTEGVMKTEAVQMRRSGSDIFAEVTISLKGDSSFEEAHKISANVEKNIRDSISNSKVTVHFEPTWKDVPIDYIVNKVASSVRGVEGIHNISYTTKDGAFISLHVMVDRGMSLRDAHEVSDRIEEEIKKSVEDVRHITIHLEPYVSIPKSVPVEDLTIEEQVAGIIREYPRVRRIGRVITFQLQDVFKVDIDCSFDGSLTIEQVHDIVSEIENKIKDRIKNAIVTIHPEPQ